MTRTKNSSENARIHNRLPSDRLAASSIGKSRLLPASCHRKDEIIYLQTLDNDLDRSFYRVLKIIKDRSGKDRSTVFDPVLTNEEYTNRVLTLIRIEKGVFHKKYTGKPWRFIKHVNEAFDHILETKTKKSKIHIQTLQVSSVAKF